MTPPATSAIADLIPHSGSMCLLEHIEHWDNEHIICSSNSHTHPNNPLRTAGKLSAINLAEYAAQAMAVHGGLLAGDQPPKPGYLAALKNTTVHVANLNSIQGPLKITAQRLLSTADGFIYSFTVHAQQLLLASGRASVLQPPA